MLNHIDISYFFKDADLQNIKDVNSKCTQIEWDNTKAISKLEKVIKKVKFNSKI